MKSFWWLKACKSTKGHDEVGLDQARRHIQLNVRGKLKELERSVSTGGQAASAAKPELEL
jgi:hypothetical protein